MRKRIVIMVMGAALLLSACGNSTETQRKQQSTTKETTVEENSEAVKNTALTLEEYLEEYRNSSTYHLLYDVALNEDAEAKDDKATYTFETDKDGKRILGTVMAHYDKVLGDTTYAMSFCRSFIQMEYPELSDAYQNVVVAEGQGEYSQEMVFDDYTIRLMPDPDMTGMTVKIEETK